MNPQESLRAGPPPQPIIPPYPMPQLKAEDGKIGLGVPLATSPKPEDKPAGDPPQERSFWKLMLSAMIVGPFYFMARDSELMRGAPLWAFFLLLAVSYGCANVVYHLIWGRKAADSPS